MLRLYCFGFAGSCLLMILCILGLMRFYGSFGVLRDWARPGIQRILERVGVYKLTDPDRAEEMQTARANRKVEQAAIRQARRLARLYAQQIVNGLTQREICYVSRVDGRWRYRRVQFDAILIPADGSTIYLHVDGRRLPSGVGFERLAAPEVCEHLSFVLGREVIYDQTVEYGAFFVINVGTGVRRLPSIYHWHQAGRDTNVLDLLPKSRSMCVAIGMGVNKKLYYEDLREWPHLLVAGATKWGKTTWLHQAITTLVVRNDADYLRLMCFDFKRGVGMHIYKDLPHMFHPELGFVKDRELADPALRLILKEMDDRFIKFAAADVEDIEGYNYRRKKRMPYLLVVIDELADILLDPEQGRAFKKRIEILIMRLAAQGRAAGIFIWAGTQTPKREVITTVIKYNLVARIAVNCSNNSASMIILDNAMAKGLPVKGRIIYQFAGLDGVELQVPWIERAQIRQIVTDLAAGRDVSRTQVNVPPEMLLAYGLRNLAGALPGRGLYERFRGQVSKRYIENMLTKYEYKPHEHGPVINLDHRDYIVLPSNRGNSPRRLYAIDGDGLPTAEQLAAILKIRTEA